MIKTPIVSIRLILGILCGVLISMGPWLDMSEAQTGISSHNAVGVWFGRAVPVDPSTAPFEAVFFEPTFFGDGNAIWNDGHELRFNHGTGHGRWVETGENSLEATIIWMTYDPTLPDGKGDAFKLRFVGAIDAGNADQMSGTLNLTLCPPGVDPLDPNDTGCQPVFGEFTFDAAQRLKPDPPVENAVDIGAGDLSQEYVLGAAFGRAIAREFQIVNPFREVVMMVNFFPDGMFMASDVLEVFNPHATAHGTWARGEDGVVRCTFLWLDQGPDNDLAGTTKVRLDGSIAPHQLDTVRGRIRPVAFPPPPVGDPFDMEDTTGLPLGTFDFTVRRIKVDQTAETVVGVALGDEPAQGSWYGTAVADDPQTAVFPAFVVLPTFHAAGNVLWNDSRERDHHTTGFGNWTAPGAGAIESAVVYQRFDTSQSNGFGGIVRVQFSGQVDAANPNKMTGSLELIGFNQNIIVLPDVPPEVTNLLAPEDLGPVTESLGTYTVTLDRITHQSASNGQ